MTDVWDDIRERLETGTQKAKEKGKNAAYTTGAIGSITAGGLGGFGSGAWTMLEGVEMAESVNTGNPELDMAAKGAIYAGSAGIASGLVFTGLTTSRKGLNWLSDRYNDERNIAEYAAERTRDFKEGASEFYEEARETGLGNMARKAVTEPEDKVVINDFASVRDPINGANTLVIAEDDMYDFLSDHLDEEEADIVTELYGKFGGFVTDPADRVLGLEVNGQDITEEYREARSQPVLSLKTDGRNYQIPVSYDELEELGEYDQGRFTRGIVDELGETTGLNRLRQTDNYPSINQAEELVRQIE